MKRRLSVIAVAALATGVLAVGCGDDEDDALTHDELVTQANEICAEGNAELEQPDQQSEAEFEAFVTDTLVPNVQSQIADIRDLGIPEQDEDLNSTLDEAELITQDLAEDPALISEGDPFASINQELTDAGLTECAS